jgi:hypothetical protein
MLGLQQRHLHQEQRQMALSHAGNVMPISHTLLIAYICLLPSELF